MAGTASWWQDAWVRLASPYARRWYVRSMWGIAYLAIPIVLAWIEASAPLTAALTTAFVVAVGVFYMVIPPLILGRTPVAVVSALAAFIAFTLLGMPLMGVSVVYFWIYPPVMASFSWQPHRLNIGVLVVIVVAQVGLIVVDGQWDAYWYAPAVTTSVGIMMIALAGQVRTTLELRAAHAEIARLAIVDERARFARDMHDVLGHSLTVVAVKAELVRKLVRRDPARAETEAADIERLSRSALAELRVAIAGYRERGLPTELRAAGAALAAAEITPHLPADADIVQPGLRELFAWVLRESVTNVIRHSGAHNCWVELQPVCIMIGDDGRGGAHVGAADASDPATGDGSTAVSGSGLAGLAVRASAAGARLSVRPRPDGGTVVVAERMPA